MNMKNRNNSILMAPVIYEKDPDRNDPDRPYRYIDLGISTRPDGNCGNCEEAEL